MTISRVRIGPSVLARAWIVYLILGILVVAAYFVAIDPNLQDAAYNLCGASAVGAMFIGAWLWRPERLRAWMLLAVGVALQSLGDVMLTFLTSSDGIEPFPSAADVPYLAGYVLIAFGLVELVRAGNREHDRTAWVDALIVAAAAAIFIWVLVIRDEIASSADIPTALVAAAYPFFDIVQIAVVAHLILGGRRTPAVILLGAGFAASLVADLAYAVLSSRGHTTSDNSSMRGGSSGIWLWGPPPFTPRWRSPQPDLRPRAPSRRRSRGGASSCSPVERRRVRW